MKRRVLYFIFASLLLGCATEQTKVREKVGRGPTINEWILDEKTVVLDARSSIAHSAARIPASRLIQWWDFTEHARNKRGWLQRDLSEVSRKLSHYGIFPTTPVVVVGAGMNGNGEEGRIAWMLQYLGVKNVRTAGFDSYKGKLESGPDENFIKSVNSWEPDPQKVTLLTRDEFTQRMKSPKEKLSGVRCIDVGSRPALKSTKLLRCVRIEWKKFFQDNMNPREAIADELEKIEILPAYEVVLISNDGVESAAATFALQKLGFAGARNYAGGWADFP